MLRPQILQTVLLPAIALCIFVPAQEFTHGRPAPTGGQGTPAQQGSPFAQGFSRGYEQGFHAADLDFHVGRTDRKLDTFPEYRKATSGYREGLGDRNSFQQGYRLGFAEGYDDSFHSRHFSARVAEQAARAGSQK